MIADISLPAFPAYESQTKRLVESHLALEDEPLLLALYYAQDADSEDVYLFEVIENFGAGDISEDKELFEVTFGSSEGFPLPSGRHLHLILTNPDELKAAFANKWEGVEAIRSAIWRGNFRSLYSHPTKGAALMAEIHG